MKKIISILIIFCLMFVFTGCARCINIEYENVEVEIVDSYHRGFYMQPIYNGKSFYYISHPAIYKITVEYNGKRYTFDGSDTYNKFKDKIGQKATGVLQIKTYDDNTIKYDINKVY